MPAKKSIEVDDTEDNDFKYEVNHTSHYIELALLHFQGTFYCQARYFLLVINVLNH